jgi:Cytochrome c554 and c-prime
VKTPGIIAVLVLTISSFPIIISHAVQSDKVYTVMEKPYFLSSAGKSRFMQEKSKYLYVGAEKCATVCHNNEEMGFQYDIWKKSLHAEAYKILTSKEALRYEKNAGIAGNPQENSVCLKCHITGGDLDLSFFAVTYKKDDGVTCESCHKGEYITKAFLPKETDCLKCHNNSVHKTHKFDFNKRCAKIAHPRPKVNPVKS